MTGEDVAQLGPAVDRRCNDDGDGGVCTFCHRLHTATVVKACVRCGGPAMVDNDYCNRFPRCLTPDEVRRVEAAVSAAAALEHRAILDDR